MLTWIKKRTANRANATELYGNVVTHARLPEFYAVYGVPDTTEGRFGMLILHLWMVLERLRGAGKEGIGLSRRVIEAFVTDMDDCMREMGVGDLTVPKKVKGAAATLYARAAACREALREPGDTALADAIRDQLGESADAEALARYVRQAVAKLAAGSLDGLLAGKVAFPDPSGALSMEGLK
jgi:cytochrome b pre-mRNA-processing protein 3